MRHMKSKDMHVSVAQRVGHAAFLDGQMLCWKCVGLLFAIGFVHY